MARGDPNAPVELAGRKLGWALDYLLRNVTKGEGDKHGAIEKFGEAMADLVEASFKEGRTQAMRELARG